MVTVGRQDLLYTAVEEVLSVLVEWNTNTRDQQAFFLVKEQFHDTLQFMFSYVVCKISQPESKKTSFYLTIEQELR